MIKYHEINFDGIPAPYHNYGGLAFGNVASQGNKGGVSHPRVAALQALEKAKFLADLGLKQAIIPPQLRPDFDMLGSRDLQSFDLKTLAQAYSSAAMWTANAATIAPSCDASELRLVVANLASNKHREIEAKQTYKILSQIFENVHQALPAELPDEGAANHTRLNRKHLFVYGADTEKYPARQSLQASQKVAELLGVEGVFIKQNPEAIDAGVFHNDVISVGHENVFLYHEKAFIEFDPQSLEDVILIEIKDSELPLEAAVKNYFFNSQIVTLPSEKMAVIAPEEAAACGLFEKIISDKQNPIEHVYYKNLRESMRNGGGPACLRLRVLMNDKEIAAIKPNVFLDNKLYAKLKMWIEKHYPESLKPEDLYDIKLYENTRAALKELEKIMELEIL